jgi:hypothetical protein
VCAGLDFDMTKVTASGGHSNAVGLRLYYDAVSRPSRFDIEVVCPLGVPFAKGDEPCIMVGWTPAEHSIEGLTWVDSPHPTLSPAFAEAASRRQAPGARGFMRLFTEAIKGLAYDTSHHRDHDG